MKLFPEARILDVNLTDGCVAVRTLDSETYRLYPGGSSLALYLILSEMDPRVDPLSPENMLAFAVSPTVGLPFAGNSRMVAAAKSPLTGCIGDSQSGGFFPATLKASGWDAILFRGKAKTPVYLAVDGDKAELRSAEALWGKGTADCEDAITAELGEKLDIACIGPAGENGVRYAAIINMANRANGRTGMGAVMGSKNLKAVALKKQKPREAYNKDQFLEIFGKQSKRLEENEGVAGLGKYGTDGDTEGFNEDGFLPTRNWTTGYFPEGASKITGTTMYETVLKERDTCYACAVRCKRVVEIENKVDPRYGGPEYETVGTFGPYCGVSSLEDICVANQLCNKYGIDTISCGATIAFAMECFEKGLLTERDTDGLRLNWGTGENFAPLIERIAKREGFGDLLAEGSARMAEKIGKGSEKFVMAVKKQEFPAHMPHWKPALGIVYAVNPFGADHQSSEHDPFLVAPADAQSRRWLSQIGLWKGYDDSYAIDDEKVRFAYETQAYFSMLDTLCLCQFTWGPAWELYGPTDLINLCKHGIGWETSIAELLKAGERRINMMRWFNAQNGFTKEQDKLPERIFEPLPDGPSKGVRLDREKFYEGVELYYRFAGWESETGNPTDISLRKLSLGWLAEKSRRIRVALNGKERDIDFEDTVAKLLKFLGYPKSQTSVWVNEQKLLAGEYDTHTLKAGDQVKAVRLFGGG
ncbi:MAG: aldehyde:ferredoxin oxidoreductase [Clostridia bacterium]|nr:aldehyde:ferredoxin oxidoreductase [Clostridia bacterium]